MAQLYGGYGACFMKACNLYLLNLLTDLSFLKQVLYPHNIYNSMTYHDDIWLRVLSTLVARE